jgi:hypothetical protein
MRVNLARAGGCGVIDSAPSSGIKMDSMPDCPRCRSALVAKRTHLGFHHECAGCGGRSVALSIARRQFDAEVLKNLWLAVSGGIHPGIPIFDAETTQLPFSSDPACLLWQAGRSGRARKTGITSGVD